MSVPPVGTGHQQPPRMPSVICAGTPRHRDPAFFSGTGDHDVEDWLFSYERVSAHNNWDDSTKLNSVIFYLMDVANLWYRNHEADIRTWSDFRRGFTEVFDRPAVRKLRAEQRLRGRAQQQGENFTSYIEDVVDLGRRVNATMSDAEKIKHILKGIDNHAFQMLVAKNPRTMTELITICQSYDELRRQRVLVRHPLGTNEALSSLTVPSEELQLETRIRFRPGRDSSPTLARAIC